MIDKLREALAAHVEDWRKAARTRGELAAASVTDAQYASQNGYARALLSLANIIERLLAETPATGRAEAIEKAATEYLAAFDAAGPMDECVKRERLALAALRASLLPSAAPASPEPEPGPAAEVTPEVYRLLRAIDADLHRPDLRGASRQRGDLLAALEPFKHLLAPLAAASPDPEGTRRYGEGYCQKCRTYHLGQPCAAPPSPTPGGSTFVPPRSPCPGCGADGVRTICDPCCKVDKYGPPAPSPAPEPAQQFFCLGCGHPWSSHGQHGCIASSPLGGGCLCGAPAPSSPAPKEES